MIRWAEVMRHAWPGAALVVFCGALVLGPDMLRFDALSAPLVMAIAVAAALAVYLTVSLFVSALDETAFRTRRLVFAAAIETSLGAGMFAWPVSGLCGLAFTTVLLIAGLRAVPRVALIGFALLAVVKGGLAYFGAVLVAVGLIAMSSSWGDYLRELLPRRFGVRS